MKMEAEARQKRQVLLSMQPNLHAVMHAIISCIPAIILIHDMIERGMALSVAPISSRALAEHECLLTFKQNPC